MGINRKAIVTGASSGIGKGICAVLAREGYSLSTVYRSNDEGMRDLEKIVTGVYGQSLHASESIALELAMHGIRVNNVAPGATELERVSDDFYDKLGRKIPLRRVGKPEDIGEAVLWLASDAASYITGTSLKVDGGLILPGMPEAEDDTNPYYDWKPILRSAREIVHE